MKGRKINISLLVFLLLIICGFQAARADGKDLGITPRLQETPMWCWISCGQMIFEYYEIPNLNPAGNYQCGIIGVTFRGTPCQYDCSRCSNIGAGSMQGIQRMISDYPSVARAVTRNSRVPQLRSDGKYRNLTQDEIKEELDNDRPIVAGVNPNGFVVAPGNSMHAVLIVGYDEDEGTMTLTVNDPFPYDLPQFVNQVNPYSRANGKNNYDGSYKIEYSNFKRYLAWNTSIVGIGR